MARVPPRLHPVKPFLGLPVAVRDRAVDDEQVAPLPQDPRGLADEPPGRAEVVGGDAHGHQVERPFAERDLLRGEAARLQGEPFLAQEPAGVLEHPRREVARGDAPAHPRQPKRRVASPGRYIQGAAPGRGPHAREGLLHVRGVRQNVGPSVPVALAVELRGRGRLRGVEV